MATGTVTLLWYFACCGVSLFVAAIATALVIHGQRVDRKRREARRQAQAAPGTERRQGPESRVDPDPPAR